MTTERMARFTEGHLGCGFYETLLVELGPTVIDGLIEAGVVGKAFSHYFISENVQQNYARVRTGLADGSARKWVIAFYQKRTESLAQQASEAPEDPEVLQALQEELAAFARHLPTEARAWMYTLNAIYDIEFAEA